MAEHVVSPKIYAVIFIVLLIFTATTAGVSFINLGPFNIVVALVIATTKASLVILFFMHARYIRGRTQLVVIAGFFWLCIMLSLTLTDYTSRRPQPRVAQFQTSSGTVTPGSN